MKRFKHMHPRLTAILVDGLTVILMLLAWLLLLSIGLHVWAAPAPAEFRVRDGVHSPVFTALQSIDRDELADMRAAEEWTEPTHETIAQRTESVATVLDALETETLPETVPVIVPEVVPETEPAPSTSRFTERERYLLLHIMMHEAGNQGVIGQALVGRVVLNRVQSGRFPGSIEAVLFQPGQFGPEPEICRYEPNADSYAALELLENGWDESQGAMFFCTTSFSWATYLFTYRGHNFFV